MFVPAGRTRTRIIYGSQLSRGVRFTVYSTEAKGEGAGGAGGRGSVERRRWPYAPVGKRRVAAQLIGG